MQQENYPSGQLTYRRADLSVHLIGLALILTAGGLIVAQASVHLELHVALAITLYALCALASNLASCAYHFAPWHPHRKLMRRIDHAAIYPSIAGTFTPFFVVANTTWTITLLYVCWAIAILAMWNKITNPTVQSRWSTASYLGLGALGLCAIPDMREVPLTTLWCILIGAICYVIGVAFYVRRTMPYRYAVWHSFVNFGGIAMFFGVWIAVFN